MLTRFLDKAISEWGQFKDKCYIKISYLSLVSIIISSSIILIFPKLVYPKEDNNFIEPLVKLYLDQQTIKKGYTVTTPEGDFKVGITAQSVKVPVYVSLKPIPLNHLPPNSTKEIVSPIWEFDIRRVSSATSTQTLGALEKPIWLSLDYLSDSLHKKVIYFWNKPNQSWQPLPTRTDFDRKIVKAAIHLPFARLAVFNEPAVYEGIASWYTYQGCLCAASTIYEKGTHLRVTNISDSRRHGKFIDIVINDYGPEEWTGRLIDLDKVAYSKIGLLGGGLMPVRVEQLP